MRQKYFLGIGLNLFDARAVLLGEDGRAVAAVEKQRQEVSANETIEVLLELFDRIIAKAKKYRRSIERVGLALGGIINAKKGVVHWPQKQDSSYIYISVPLKEYLEKKFGFPIVVENDANACAVAEHRLNFTKYRNILYMFSGVGCGMIIEGKLYRGRDGGAGELFLTPQKTMSSRLGDFSFLRQWPADLDMVARAKELISLGEETSLIKKITPTGSLSLNDIFGEAKKKDKVSQEVLKEAALSLGAKTAFLINLLNTEAVVIGGGMEEAGNFFLEECARAIKKFSFGEMRRNIKIFPSRLGRKATSIGAGLLALRKEPLQC